jgi:hypothetical protein
MKVTFIGGPLDGQETEIDDAVTSYSVPEVTFSWTEVGGKGNGPTIRKEVRHIYERDLDQPDVFVYDRTREVVA